jgi:hypothetical protein
MRRSGPVLFDNPICGRCVMRTSPSTQPFLYSMCDDDGSERAGTVSSAGNMSPSNEDRSAALYQVPGTDTRLGCHELMLATMALMRILTDVCIVSNRLLPAYMMLIRVHGS